MSIVFRTRGWLSIPQLVSAWASELSKGRGDPARDEQALLHSLLEDIINGRLDDAGPLRDGRKLGLRLELHGRPCFIEGHEIRPLICSSPPGISLHRIVVMKEAVLDFASRHKVPPPSWWADDPIASSSTDDSTASVLQGSNLIAASSVPSPSPPDLARTRGRKPKRREKAQEAMSRDIQDGRITESGLRDMPEKQLAAGYNVSRDTARKARNEVLLAISSKPQWPPISTSST